MNISLNDFTYVYEGNEHISSFDMSEINQFHVMKNYIIHWTCRFKDHDIAQICFIYEDEPHVSLFGIVAKQ